MDRFLVLILNNGLVWSLIAIICLLYEGYVNIRPRDAIAFRSIPIFIGFGVGYVFFIDLQFLVSSLFLVSGTLAFVSRLTTREYWNAEQRLNVNFLPILSYVITAMATYFCAV